MDTLQNLKPFSIPAEDSICRAIFDDAPDAIFFVNLQAEIIDCNQTALRLFEAPHKNKLLRTNILTLQEDSVTEKDKDFFLEEMAQKSIYGGERKFKTFNNSSFVGFLDARSKHILDEVCILVRIRKIQKTEAAIGLQTIITGTSNVTGNQFFETLTKVLGDFFNAKFAFVGKIIPKTKMVETLHLRVAGETQPNFSYELKGTPCANVINGNGTISFYPENVDFLFPEDLLLVQMGIKSYFGSPVLDKAGTPIGLVVVMDNETMEEIPYGRYILSIFASRVGAEIQRINKENELKENYEELQAFEEELRQQSEELLVINEHLEQTSQEIERQRSLLAQKNKTINASLRYAKRIQEGILPRKIWIEEFFSDVLIFYKPLQLVSGDFYWFSEQENKQYLVVADCTGHGVPGAFMSMIANTLLNKIIKDSTLNLDEILVQLNHEIAIALRQRETGNTDGLEISLCEFEPNKRQTTLRFVGSKQYIFIVQSGKLERIKGNRVLIGGDFKHKKSPFDIQERILNQGDKVYLLSDGFIDQASPSRKNFSIQKLQNLIEKVHTESMRTQCKYFQKALKQHQQDAKQRDDITLVGVTI